MGFCKKQQFTEKDREFYRMDSGIAPENVSNCIAEVRAWKMNMQGCNTPGSNVSGWQERLNKFRYEARNALTKNQSDEWMERYELLFKTKKDSYEAIYKTYVERTNDMNRHISYSYPPPLFFSLSPP